MAGGRHSTITDEMIEALRREIGVEIETRNQFNLAANDDTIRHFAWAVGDPNPIHNDPDYAATTRWGRLIAPPPFLFTCMGSYPMGMPGIHGLFSGTEFEMNRPIQSGDRIRSTVALTDLVEKSSQFAGRTFIQTWTFTFYNQAGDLIGRARRSAVRAERDTAREKGKYQAIVPSTYTPEELAAIEADYEREVCRGADTLFWDDVVEGTDIPSVVKGPLTLTDIVGWKIGWGFRPYIMPHRIGYEYRKKHPRLANRNDQGVWDVPERVHWENDFAREIGAPAAYDYGPQRVSWFGHLIGNWMGDDGFLKLLSVQVRRFNIVGDATWLRGRIRRKSLEAGEPLVELDVWAENQRGEQTAPGFAIVRLPRRATSPAS